MATSNSNTKQTRQRRPVDLSGMRFGKLVPLKMIEGPGRQVWECLCDCGQTARVTKDHLFNNTRSCGCLRRKPRLHGLSRTVEHNAWWYMITRCGDPGRPEYPRYGGRGIKVCERWQEFVNFLADMGPRPSPRHSIDRIDNDGNYEPSNCRWATPVQQSTNTRRNVRLTYNGITKCYPSGVGRWVLRQEY